MSAPQPPAPSSVAPPSTTSTTINSTSSTLDEAPSPAVSPNTIQNTIVIPGDTLEGGGQLVRLSIALSALTDRPVLIKNIRGNRPTRGLKDQHLTAVQWLARICGAEVAGATKGSERVLFVARAVSTSSGAADESTPKSSIPDGAKHRNVQDAHSHWWRQIQASDGSTAREIRVSLSGVGAITLVLQALLPVLLFTSTTAVDTNRQQIPYLLRLTGGTNGPFAPSIDYITHVLLPNLTLFGFPKISLLDGITDRGWAIGPSRRGTISFLIEPLPVGATLPAFTLQGHGGVVKTLSIVLLASGDLRDLLRKEAVSTLKKTFRNIPIDILTDEDSNNTKRLYLLIVAEMTTGIRIGRDWLYDRKIKVKERNGLRNAVEELVEGVVTALIDELESNAAVDEWMEDQLVIFQALSNGKSRIVGTGTGAGSDIGKYTGKKRKMEETRPSLHTQTARWLMNELLGVGFDEDGGVRGIGLVARTEARCLPSG